MTRAVTSGTREAAAERPRMTAAARQRQRQRILSVASPIGLLIVWEILIQLGFGDRRFVPPPSAIAVRFWAMCVSGELFGHVGATVTRVVVGYIVGIVPAIAVGLAMAMWRPVRYAVDPLIAAIYPIPKIALMPLLLLAFGFGETSKIAVVTIAAFFPVVINTYTGAANIERIYIDAARNFGASPATMFRRVVFFGSLPMIFAGLRVALGVSFIVIVAAEFVAAKQGIGQMIWSSWDLLQVDRMFVGIVSIGILGVASTALLQEVERLVIPWKHQ